MCKPEPPLSPSERRRRVLITCCNFVRSYALYRPIFQAHKKLGTLSPEKANFWWQVANDALDICILEWCKVFAEPAGAHYYKKALSKENQADYFVLMLSDIGFSADEFDKLIAEMKKYRDKFVAHLDSERTMRIPGLDPALACIKLLSIYVVERESVSLGGGNVPRSSEEFRKLEHICFQETQFRIRQEIGEE